MLSGRRKVECKSLESFDWRRLKDVWAGLIWLAAAKEKSTELFTRWDI